jgi:hypothetical protein
MCYKIQLDRAGRTRHRPGPTKSMLGLGFKRQPEIEPGSMPGHTLAQFLQAGPCIGPARIAKFKPEPGPAGCQVCMPVLCRYTFQIELTDRYSVSRRIPTDRNSASPKLETDYADDFLDSCRHLSDKFHSAHTSGSDADQFKSLVAQNVDRTPKMSVGFGRRFGFRRPNNNTASNLRCLPLAQRKKDKLLIKEVCVCSQQRG